MNRKVYLISSRITAENEINYLIALRLYFRRAFAEGISDKSFLDWIEMKVKEYNTKQESKRVRQQRIR